MGGAYSTFMYPDVTPDYSKPPTFDPLYGFENGRKPRKALITAEEMEVAQIKPDQRDYCAHHLIDFYKCRREKFPWVHGCKHDLHVWNECQFEDYVLRMKEYERERRLKERAKRKAAKDGEEM